MIFIRSTMASSFSTTSPRLGKIVGCLFVAAFGFWPVHGQATGGPTGDLAQTPGLAEYMTKTRGEIQRMTDAFSKLPRKPIGFGCNLTLAHGGTIRRVPLDVLEAAADALKEAGASRIEINPVVTGSVDPAVEAKYKALIAHIRGLGLAIAINPESADPNQGGIHDFAEWQSAAVREYAQWAAEFQPDYFVLIHEPTTMAARLHVQTTPADWRGFIEATNKVVRQASPKSRIGAGCFAGLTDREIPFFKEFSQLGELDMLSIDNYVGTERAINTMDQMVAMAVAAHKPYYMEETWRPHFIRKGAQHTEGASIESISALGYGYEGFASLDAKWMEAMSLYAATHGMESMTVFQTRCFFLYVPSQPTDGPDYDRKVQAAILQKQRTPAFDGFLSDTREFGAGG